MATHEQRLKAAFGEYCAVISDGADGSFHLQTRIRHARERLVAHQLNATLLELEISWAEKYLAELKRAASTDPTA
jgi:hypothetical protein